MRALHLYGDAGRRVARSRVRGTMENLTVPKNPGAGPDGPLISDKTYAGATGPDSGTAGSTRGSMPKTIVFDTHQGVPAFDPPLPLSIPAWSTRTRDLLVSGDGQQQSFVHFKPAGSAP